MYANGCVTMMPPPPSSVVVASVFATMGTSDASVHEDSDDCY